MREAAAEAGRVSDWGRPATPAGGGFISLILTIDPEAYVLDTCLPSPGGRYLAVVQGSRETESYPACRKGRTAVVGLRTGTILTGKAPLPGVAVGRSAEGDRLWIAEAERELEVPK